MPTISQLVKKGRKVIVEKSKSPAKLIFFVNAFGLPTITDC